jgi:ketosteroid isomerase-like protein
MSQELEDFVRSVYDRFNEGERLPSADLWHADGVYVNSSDDPDPGTHRGLDAIRRQFQTWIETYPDLRVEPFQILVNGDRVFVWARWSGHGAGSGVPIEMEMAQVCTIEDGKVRRIEEYMDRTDGLEAAGLGEWPPAVRPEARRWSASRGSARGCR